MTAKSNLIASLMATPAATPAKGAADAKRYLSGVKPDPDAAKADRDMVEACAEVVRLMIAERVAAIVATLTGEAKVSDAAKRRALSQVDPERVTLRYDGRKVTANLSVPVVLADGSRFYVNVGGTMPAGVAPTLEPYCQRVSREK